MKAVPDLPGFNLNFKHGNADFFVNLIVMAACYLSALVLLSTCVHVRKARVNSFFSYFSCDFLSLVPGQLSSIDVFWEKEHYVGRGNFPNIK
eukprot:scaffold269952_cov17-Tisochrysis_lutea.AAC.3